MFDKLIEFLISAWEDLIFWKIVNEWEKGVYLRFGKFRKVVNPGITLKFPHFDKIITHEVITQTVNLPPQTLTTLDEKDVVLKSIVRYHVHDVKKFLLGVMHAGDVLVDTTQGIIRDIVERTDWMDLVEVNDIITDEVSKVVNVWGITIERITLTDLGLVKTYRIMGDGQKDFSILPTNTNG